MSKKRNFKSLVWFSVENLTTIAFGLISVFFIARFFGPDNLGKLSLVQSASGLLMFLATLGLDHFIVRDLARDPDDGEYIGSVMLMQLLGWLLYVFGIVGALFTMGRLVTPQMIWITAFVLLTTLFTRATLGRLYFQAVNIPKAIAASAIVSRLVAIAYIIFAINFDLAYEWAIFYLPLQAIIQCGMLFIQYQQHATTGWRSWRVNTKRSYSILKEAAPALLAAAIFPIFMQSDVLIISHLLSDHAAGIYSAASRLIIQFNFVGPIITMAFYVALSNRLHDEIEFKKMVSGLVCIFFILAFPVALVTSIFADEIVHLLYGHKFQETGPVLRVLAWVWLFVIPAALYSRLLILRGQVRYELIKSIAVAAISVSLNFALIPHIGVIAAAYASVISYAIADFLIYGIFRETRDVFAVAVKSVADMIFRPRLAYQSIMYVLNSK
ncbi:flippase [Chitinibacter tainanensis]|uniref:flippase n=1 Tax=Chitinibacter tainanensis TaxID=230667 RepID=UPI002352B480|nr:flippase [Chitinibacter tainanensis]